MTVPSGLFLCFGIGVALLMHIQASARWRNFVLLVANFGFLASLSQDPRAWLPYAVFVALGYASVTAMQRAPRATAACVLPIICGTVIAVYVTLKQYTFVPAALLPQSPYTVVGLSYVFFRVLHLIIDARNKTLPGRVTLVPYLSFLLDFTCLVSGPIQRYQDFHRSIHSPATLDAAAAGQAGERLIVGFFKVEVLSELLLHAHDAALGSIAADQPLLLRVGYATLLAASYPIYLYCNFSGYTDFVIGIARLRGAELPENFDRPFSAENFINFWSRWHITLSAWLRTYVYAPLLIFLSRRFPSPRVAPGLAVVALFVTFFLIGVWHGRTSMFIVFGCLQGLGVAANKLYQIGMANRLGRSRYRALAADPIYRAFCRGLTFTWFAFTMFWFWASWSQLATTASAVGPIGALLAIVALVAGAAVVLELLVAVRAGALRVTWSGHPVFLTRYVRTVWCTMLFVVFASATALLDLPAPELVYRAF